MASESGASDNFKRNVRRRTSKQLQRKRLLDRDHHRARREREKAWKNQVQEDLQAVQAQADSLRAALASAHADRDIQGSNIIAAQQSPSLQHQDMVYPSPSAFGGNEPLESRSDSTQPVCSSAEFLPAIQTGEVPILNEIRGLVSSNQYNLLAPPKPSVQTPIQNLNLGFAEISQLVCQPAKLDELVSDNRTYAHHFTPTQLRTVITDSGVHNDDDMVIKSSGNPRTHSSTGFRASALIEEEPGSLVVDCRCNPKQHISYAVCIEQSVFTAILKNHNQSQKLLNPAIVPRDPTLFDLLFLGDGENEVSQIVSKMLRRPGFRTLPHLFSSFLLVYRVLRYKFFPCLETFHDIPAWLRPNDIQECTPHLVFTDFIHFPKLRNAMVLGTIDYTREEFDYDYVRHLSMNWPDDESLLVRNDAGTMILNPQFLPHICTQENWSMDSGFAAKYPHMASFVVIRD